jgi:molecular chaperone DnaK
VSILEVGDGVVEVLSTNGDTHLGGDNVDEAVIDYLVEEFKKDSGIDVSKDSMALQRLREAAEKTKKELSAKTSSDINLPFLTADASGPKHFQINLTRAKFDQLVDDIVSQTFKSCKQALEDADKKVSDVDQVILVGGSTRIPLVISEVTKFFKKEPNRSVNPDEVVALGAAVQGGVLSGDVKDVLLLDVTPLRMGIETMGGVTTVLISRNTTIPAKKSEIFSTAADNQPSVEINVLQGERPMSADNRTLGRFKLDGIPPAPRGVPQVEVSFDIDADGILSVSAKDKATGKEQNITITSSGGLSDTEIDKMVKDAQENEEQDRQKRELSESRNKLDSLVFQTERTQNDSNVTIPEDEKENIENALAEARQALESDDKETINVATTNLETVLHDLAKSMYESSQDESASDAREENDDVIDAEFVDDE